jgi:hypothetical protein
VVRGVVRADVAADRAAIPHLYVRDQRAHLGEDRPRHLDLRRLEQLRVRRHGADLERVAGDRDRPQLVQPIQVDEDVRRGRAGLHHVDQRLAAGQRAGALVSREEPDRFVHGGRARIFDLAKEHGGITPISR